MPSLESLASYTLKKGGVVSFFDWTKRGINEGSNELCVSSYKGLGFGHYDAEYKFHETPIDTEYYFSG